MLFLSCSLLLSVSFSYEDAVKATSVYRRGRCKLHLFTGGAMKATPVYRRGDAGIPTPHNRDAVKLHLFTGGGDAGTNPSHQRWFLPVSATRLRRYSFAVSRDERHCAASASHSGETQGDASPPRVRSPPAPTRSHSLPRKYCFIVFHCASFYPARIATGRYSHSCEAY